MWWWRIKTPRDFFRQPFQALVRTLGRRLIGLVKNIRGTRTCPRDVKRILVIRRNRLGDAVLTAHYLRALADERPDLQITVITNSYSQGIYEEILPEAETLALPEKYLRSPLGVFFHPEVQRLRSTVFDISLIASGGFSSRSILLLRMFRSRFHVGVRDETRPSLPEAFLDSSLPSRSLPSNAHQIEKLRAVFALADLSCLTKPTPLRVRESKTVLIFTDCNRAESRVIPQIWTSFAFLLLNKSLTVKICTRNQNTVFPAEFSRVVCRDTPSMIQEIKQVDHVVCSEGGASHLAAMLGRYITVFSGVQIQSSWFPYGEGCALLERRNLTQTLSPEEMELAFWRKHPDLVTHPAHPPVTCSF